MATNETGTTGDDDVPHIIDFYILLGLKWLCE